MRTRNLVAFAVTTLGVAAIVSVALTAYWQRQQPIFKDAPKLIAAMNAYASDIVARGRPLPSTVTLRELIAGGYISASEVRAFDGMDVTLSPSTEQTRPQDVLIRVRLPDGSVTALLVDGSVLPFSK